MRSLGPFDRGLYALFSKHADASRHEVDRKRYRGTTMITSFDVYIARVYGLAWVAGTGTAVLVTGFVLLLPAPTVVDAVALAERFGIHPPTTFPRKEVTVLAGVLVGLLTKEIVVRGGGRYLAWMARARRADIDRTLPGAVRYLHVLSSGTVDERDLLHRVAAMDDAYGETATTFRKALNIAELTGSLDFAIRQVARDTPSRNTLAPFLLQLHEHATQGPEAMAGYLQLESRMLGNRRSRTRERAEGFLELVVELFVVLLVLPTLLVVGVSVVGTFAPGLDASVATPFGATTLQRVLAYSSSGFILVVGALAAWLVGTLRPVDDRWTRPSLADEPRRALVDVIRNPAVATGLFALLAIGLAAGLSQAGVDPVNVVVLGYIGFALPVGAVSIRRARLDEAKDRHIEDFVHAIASHVGLGQPFTNAVEHVARDVDLGALNDDVASLAFRLGLTTPEGEQRAAALNQFVDAVGTPLAGHTVGLVTGALDAGSDTETVFEALQREVGRLYHEKQALRTQLLVYVVVGWGTAVLLLAILVVVSIVSINGAVQLALGPVDGAASLLIPYRLESSSDQFYVVAQATMVACGWFAGAASRGRYEALLHSGALVALAYVVFAGFGLL